MNTEALQAWRWRVKHWGWIKRERRTVGFVAGGIVVKVDANLPPKDESGYPVIEGARFPLLVHNEGPNVLHSGAGGFRLRIPPRADRTTHSIFVGRLGAPMWASDRTRLTREGRAMRRIIRERKHGNRVRVTGYGEHADAVHQPVYVSSLTTDEGAEQWTRQARGQVEP